MSNLKNWISAFRLRTLPLSLSGIIFGSFVALHHGFWDSAIFSFALLTTLLFQVLSNLANDLGDGVKGTDNEHRLGPVRAVQSGNITKKQMKKAVLVTGFLSFISAAILIFYGSKNLSLQGIYFYLFLTILCIAAAIMYTMGKKAYGYFGFGDVFVFVFFGWVSILGVYTLFSKEFDIQNILPATSFGLLSVAVLNLNNMRDRENDQQSHKRTLVVRIGLKNAKIYHLLLIFTSLVCFIVFYVRLGEVLYFISLLPYLLLFFHMKKVSQTEEEREFDPELKKVALSTFMIAVLFMFLVLIRF